ncbi:MAG: hypothetical protein A2010_11670 [Nitrospirae bacterium GWD2_57_9]|nr:MAG: hypothetical protein A2010_11670 [Nitrospirae bacterium GWD2_57_9]
MAGAVLVQGPIPQDPRYHVFADKRTLLGVPNGMNLLSSVLFVLAGGWGIAVLQQRRKAGERKRADLQYLLFFSGVLLSGMGSMYYHLEPANSSLVWDRLPMSIAFTALFSSVVSECIDARAGDALLFPLLTLGIFSVLFWAWTEQTGSGDLRPYILVQFLPLVLIPLILILYRPPRDYAAAIWGLAVLYLISKGFEVADRQVYALTGAVSGHTIKHVLAAAGTGLIAAMLDRREGRRETA